MLIRAQERPIDKRPWKTLMGSQPYLLDALRKFDHDILAANAAV
jgi:hypothetical protein